MPEIATVLEPVAKVATSVASAPAVAVPTVDALQARVSTLQQEKTASIQAQPPGVKTPEAIPPPTQAIGGIPPEVASDPAYLQIYGEAYAQAQKDGPVDASKVSQKALEQYNKQQETPENQKANESQEVKALKQEVEELKGELQGVKEQLLQITSSLSAMLPAINELVQNAHANEKDPQKKEHWAKVLLKLLAVASLAIFVEGAKASNPIQGARG